MGAMMGESAVQATATGRPGRAVTTRGNAAPAQSSPLTPAGYESTQLDESLRAYVATCERSIRTAESLGKKVEEAVTTLVEQIQGSPEEKAELLTKFHERLSKANLNLVKSTDELTRLRSFLAGGPDSRPDLTVKGEIELRAILFAAVKSQGFRIVTEAGVEVEA